MKTNEERGELPPLPKWKTITVRVPIDLHQRYLLLRAQGEFAYGELQLVMLDRLGEVITARESHIRQSEAAKKRMAKRRR